MIIIHYIASFSNNRVRGGSNCAIHKKETVTDPCVSKFLDRNGYLQPYTQNDTIYSDPG